jgi:hypothetical protein
LAYSAIASAHGCNRTRLASSLAASGPATPAYWTQQQLFTTQHSLMCTTHQKVTRFKPQLWQPHQLFLQSISWHHPPHLFKPSTLPVLTAGIDNTARPSKVTHAAQQLLHSMLLVHQV